jgi:hypothetical protein
MIDLFEDAEAVADRIGGAVDRTLTSYAGEDVNQEPHFTDRLLARIEDAVNEAETRLRWRARTLTDRGPGAEESEVGADFYGLFEATTPDVTFTKGFLAQAKRLQLNEKIATKEGSRLRHQCRHMLERTPDSFVFLYGAGGVRVISALAVFSSPIQQLDELGTKSVQEFFHDHFRCFVGDKDLIVPWLPRKRRAVLRLQGLHWVPGFARMLHIEAVAS